MILLIFKWVIVCGVILRFLPFRLRPMAIRHLSMINSMNAIFFLLYKIITHQGILFQTIKLILSLLCKIISYQETLSSSAR
jgi:hypothetical protein